MSPEKQRIKIAEACGWQDIEMEDFGEHGVPCILPMGLAHTCGQRIMLPDYLNDLNAMREAEKVLTDDQRMTCWQFLRSLTGSALDATFATAAQRAEAFLRTLNLWEDAE